MRPLFFLLTFFWNLSTVCFGQGWKSDPDFEARTLDIAPTRRLPLALPSEYSRKADCPPVRHQGKYQTCMGYALSCARTLLEVTQKGQKQWFSPIFLYKISGEDHFNDCQTPISFQVLDSIKKLGAAPFHVLPQLCISNIPTDAYSEAKPYPIQDYNPLIQPNMTLETCRSRLENIKEALVSGSSVPIGMYLPESFQTIKGSVWNCPPQYDKKNHLYEGHAMCIVGYNDHKFPEDGAFEIINSYGTNWGNQGFIWIPYKDFVRAVGAAYEIFASTQFHPQNNTPDWVGKIQFKRAEWGNKSILKVISRPEVRGSYPIALQNCGFEFQEPLYSGNQFQILVQNKIPTYIYVFSADNTQQITPLFPLGVNALIPAGQELTLPSIRNGIRLDNRIGDEYLVVLYSKSALNPTSLKKDLERAAGDFPTRISTVLGAQLPTNPSLQCHLDAEGFVSVSDSANNILAIIFHFNHL